MIIDIQRTIKQGIQTIEFTPTEEGNIPWSCWMGMIPGMFIVKENIDINNQVSVQKEINSVPILQGGSCGGNEALSFRSLRIADPAHELPDFF